MSQNNNDITNIPKDENKKEENNLNENPKEKLTEENNNKYNNNFKSSNENDSNENISNKRTLLSPESPLDEIKISVNTKRYEENLIDNIINSIEEDNINYNPNPFTSPTMKKKSYATISKMDKIIIEYNMVKANLNKIISFAQNQSNNKNEKYFKKSLEYNLSMLNYLSDLNNILKKIVDNTNIYSNKKILYSSTDTKPKTKIVFTNASCISGLENSEKMLNLYEKQYNKINDRLKTIKNKEYINNLKAKIKALDEEIAKYEQENRNIYKEQKIQENYMKNNENEKSPDYFENELIKKKGICERFQKEFIKTSKKIEKGKEYIKSNEQKISDLYDKYNNLVQMAKDMYDIERFEPVEKLKKRSKEKRLKIARKIKEYETNIHSMKAKINKLKLMFEQNKKDLVFMENEKNLLIEKYQQKKFELELCRKKLKDYENINFNSKLNEESNNQYQNNNIGINELKKRKLNIKIDSLNNKHFINKTDKTKENSQLKNNNNINSNNDNDNIYNEMNNNIKNRKKNNMALLLSSGPSLISLTREKSNFGDINDIQLLNAYNEGKDENNTLNNKAKKKINLIEKDSKDKTNKQKKMLKDNEINNEVVNINIISEPSDSNDIKKNEEKNKKLLSPLNLDIDNNKKNTISVLNKNSSHQQNLNKEMILKGLDEQEKENKTLIYSSRNINKGAFDRRNFLKLNFSFVSNQIDNNKLNKSLNTLPNERKLLNDEIEEDIITDNSADNIKETKVKKFLTEENQKDKNINIIKDNNLNINNNSIEIDKNIISEYKKSDNNGEGENRENNFEDIVYNNNENGGENQNENNEDKRENALNTILYNVNEDTKNEKFSKDKNNNKENENKEEEINKSFEEEHNFDKNEENDNESVNYDFDDGDNIIDIDYDKI